MRSGSWPFRKQSAVTIQEEVSTAQHCLWGLKGLYFIENRLAAHLESQSL